MIAIGFSLAVTISAISYTEIAQSLRIYLALISLGALAVAGFCTAYFLIYHKFLVVKKLNEIKAHSSNTNSDNASPESPSEDEIPKILEGKVDLLLKKFNDSKKERLRDSRLAKFDIPIPLFMTFSIFLIGFIINQGMAIGLNVYALFPLIGIVVLLIASFFVFLYGMINDLMEYRMLAYCLLLLVWMWCVAVPLLMFIRPFLSFEIFIPSIFFTGAVLTTLTFALSKRFSKWFIGKYPILFKPEDQKIIPKILKKIMFYVIIILLIAFIITMIVFLLSFQSFVFDLTDCLRFHVVSCLKLIFPMI